MKSIKLLLLSSFTTLIIALLIQPVFAKPTVTVHYLNVESSRVISTQSLQPFNMQVTSLPTNPVNSILNQYAPPLSLTATNLGTLSSELTLASVINTTEQLHSPHHASVQNRNNFFETAMLFNEKMQQFIIFVQHVKTNLIDITNAFFKSEQLDVEHQSNTNKQQKNCNA